MYRRIRRLKARKGFAMFMALGALVIIGVLVAGSSYVTLQETRLGQNSIVQTRAFSAAEYGLNKIQADWDKTPNLQMNNGASFDTSYTLPQGTVRVRYTRLNNETFWIVSEGRASAGVVPLPVRTAVKRVGAILRLRIPTIRANGAITTAGNITVQGSPTVSGMNSMPAGWVGCEPAPNLAGIVATPTATVSIQTPTQVVGVPQVLRDPLASDSNTYVRYGDETWNALRSQANIIVTNGTGPPQVQPSVWLDGSCNKGDQANWGEPWRTPGYVAACVNYFPIVYSSTSILLNDGRGQGILLVEGDIRINGTFEWYGLIVARDDIRKGNGNGRIVGAVMARNADLSEHSEVLGNITVNYSQCSLERAMRGSASVLQAKQRAWAELY